MVYNLISRREELSYSDFRKEKPPLLALNGLKLNQVEEDIFSVSSNDEDLNDFDILKKI